MLSSFWTTCYHFRFGVKRNTGRNPPLSKPPPLPLPHPPHTSDIAVSLCVDSVHSRGKLHIVYVYVYLIVIHSPISNGRYTITSGGVGKRERTFIPNRAGGKSRSLSISHVSGKGRNARRRVGEGGGGGGGVEGEGITPLSCMYSISYRVIEESRARREFYMKNYYAVRTDLETDDDYTLLYFLFLLYFIFLFHGNYIILQIHILYYNIVIHNVHYCIIIIILNVFICFENGNYLETGVIGF